MTDVILLTGNSVTGTEIASFTVMEVGKGAVRGRRGKKGTVQGVGDKQALNEEGARAVGEKEVRRGGQGLSNGTENGRRRKREEHKTVVYSNHHSCCNVLSASASLPLLIVSEIG